MFRLFTDEGLRDISDDEGWFGSSPAWYNQCKESSIKSRLPGEDTTG